MGTIQYQVKHVKNLVRAGQSSDQKHDWSHSHLPPTGGLIQALGDNPG